MLNKEDLRDLFKRRRLKTSCGTVSRVLNITNVRAVI